LKDLALKQAGYAQDADFVLRVRNQKDVRMNSWNQNIIPKARHWRWFKDHYYEYQIIIYKDKEVGFVRVSDGDVSIALLPGYRNRGIGTSVLKLLGGGDLFASVRFSNKSSLCCFQNAGFCNVGYMLRREE